MTILISLPTYRTPEHLLNKAIRSILAQTFTNFVLVVIGDGETRQLPVYAADDRLVVFNLPENRGRYFADAVAQTACPFDWWSPHDADDWSDKRRFDELWAARSPGAVWSVVETDGNLHTLPNALAPLRPRIHQTGYHIGLYSIDRIRAIGGSHPAYRVGYDTLFNALIRMTGEVAFSMRPYYHRHKWPGSLTKSPETGRGSKIRNEAAASIKHLYNQIYPYYVAGDISVIPPMIARSTPIQLREEVVEQAELLRKMLV